MTEPEITEHIQAPLHEVEQRLAEGWRVAPAWHMAQHHLRYSAPCFRDPHETEEWRPIPGFPGYDVSSWGRVRANPRSIRTVSKYGLEGTRIFPGRIMKPHSVAGYLSVGLSEKGKVTHQYVHRIVASAFLEQPDDSKTQVNHKNGWKTDNHFRNLEWVTASENNLHAFRELGRCISAEQRQARSLRLKGKRPSEKCMETMRIANRGERSARAKITDDQARRIHSRLKAGERQIDIASSEGISRGIVFSIASGRSWGHLWRPVEPPDA